MMDKKRYFDNGKFLREDIASDIKYRRISHEDLLALIADPAVSGAFFGGGSPDRRPREQWDEHYLDKVSYEAVSESFNRDYLLYLEEVANEVAKKKRNRRLLAGGIVLAVAAAVVIITVLASQYGESPAPEGGQATVTGTAAPEGGQATVIGMAASEGALYE